MPSSPILETHAEKPEVSSVATPAPPAASSLPEGATTPPTPNAGPEIGPPAAQSTPKALAEGARTTTTADPYEELDDANFKPADTEQPAPLPAVPTIRLGGVEPAAAVPPQPIASFAVPHAHFAAVAARPQPMPFSAIPTAHAEARQAPVALAAPPAQRRIGADSESPAASEPFRRRSRATVLAFVLLPVAALVGGAVGYRARSAAPATGSAAGVEPARPASSGDTRGPVAESSAERAKPEPSPPATNSPPEPVKKAEAAGRSPGAVAPAARAQSAHNAGAPAAQAQSADNDGTSTGILDTTQLPAGRRIVVDGRVVGASPRRVSVRCGTHSIRIGKLPPENIQVPCDGVVTFDDEEPEDPQ
jgi:hypothetical protein